MFLSSDGGSVASSCSMRIWTESLETRWINDCDALFIAGGEGAQRARHDSVLRKRLGRIAPKIPFVKAIGQGAQILAAANLTVQNRSLDFAEEPAAASFSNSMFIAEQTLTLDDPKGPIAAALSIVKRDYGAAIAREVSERSIPGAWAKLATVLDDTDGGGVRHKIDAAARWMRENYVRPISIADAARDERAQFPAPLQGADRAHAVGIPAARAARCELHAADRNRSAGRQDRAPLRCRKRRRTCEDLSQAAVDLADRIPDRRPPKAGRRMTKRSGTAARVP
jgi:putative intracellular protease/amidase